MVDTKDLAQAITEIDDVVDAALLFFRELPDSSSLSPAGPWGPKEVLAHMLWWHRYTYQSVERVLSGQEAEPPSRHVDDLNAEAVIRSAAVPLGAIADELDAAHRRLIRSISALPDPTVVVVRRADGTGFDAAGRLLGMARHIRSHVDELQRHTAG